jgi:hypothetical protein
MKTILAIYKCYSEWKVPNNIPLLSNEENKKAKYGVPWSWFIKYDTLYYFDEEGNENELKQYCSGTESHDYKRPDMIDEDECETDDEE